MSNNILGACSYILSICVFNYLQIDMYGFMVLAVLLLFDVIFGMAKHYVLFNEWTRAWVIKNGKATWFSSHKLKTWCVSKVLELIIVLLLGLVLSTYTTIWLSFVANTIVAILAVAEFISILQNYISFRQKKPIQEVDAVTAVIRRLLSGMKKKIEKYMDTSKDV